MAELFNNHRGRILVVLATLVEIMLGHKFNETSPHMVPNDELGDSVFGRPVPSCENATFCLDPPNYPSDAYLREVLGNKYMEYFDTPSTIVRNKRDYSDGWMNLCPTHIQWNRPRTATDTNKKWRWVVNNVEYWQMVQIEICVERDSECNLAVTGGYTTSCRQQYTKKKMVAVRSNGTVEVDHFILPSGCSCHAKPTG